MRDAVAVTGRKVKEVGAEEAARLGYLNTLMHLHARVRLWQTEYLCEAAAMGGHLEVLQWLRVNNCPWDRDTCAYAAMRGRFEFLKWARLNGCPWDGVTCATATHGKHLEILKWLCANGCPWRLYTRRDAKGLGYFEDGSEDSESTLLEDSDDDDEVSSDDDDEDTSE